MKRFLCVISCLLLTLILNAQSVGLQLSMNKTTSLIFPFAIRHVDRGAKEILAQQIKEADNILLLKASTSDFLETNLSVVLSDGSFYTFTITYAPSPLVWVYRLPSQSKVSTAEYAMNLADNSAMHLRLRDKKWLVEATVKGLYIQGRILYCQLEIRNESPIEYDVDYLRFFIRDRHRMKREATQEREISPLYVSSSLHSVPANQVKIIVVALEKLTLADGKLLAIEFGEKGGGRQLALRVKNRHLMKAAIIPENK